MIITPFLAFYATLKGRNQSVMISVLLLQHSVVTVLDCTFILRLKNASSSDWCNFWQKVDYLTKCFDLKQRIMLISGFLAVFWVVFWIKVSSGPYPILNACILLNIDRNAHNIVIFLNALFNRIHSYNQGIFHCYFQRNLPYVPSR